MKNNDRIRGVDINKMSEEEFQQVMDKLGKKVSEKIKSAFEESNKLLNVYGLKVVFNYELRPLENTKKEE